MDGSPLLHRLGCPVRRTLRPVVDCRTPAVDEGPRVRRVAQKAVDVRGGGPQPEQLSVVRAAVAKAWQGGPVLEEASQNLRDGPQRGETLEDELDCPLDVLVRVLDHPSVVQPDEPGGQPLTVGPLLDLPQLSGVHALPDQMQLCLAHHAPQAKQKAVVVVGRVVDAVSVGDERASQRA
jgi:hypothetical protein